MSNETTIITGSGNTVSIDCRTTVHVTISCCDDSEYKLVWGDYQYPGTESDLTVEFEGCSEYFEAHLWFVKKNGDPPDDLNMGYFNWAWETDDPIGEDGSNWSWNDPSVYQDDNKLAISGGNFYEVSQSYPPLIPNTVDWRTKLTVVYKIDGKDVAEATLTITLTQGSTLESCRVD